MACKIKGRCWSWKFKRFWFSIYFEEKKSRFDFAKGIDLIVSCTQQTIPGFDFSKKLEGGQNEYILQSNLVQIFENKINKYLVDEIKVVENYFKSLGLSSDGYILNSIKMTTNFDFLNGIKKLFRTNQQEPHVDVTTDKILYLVLVISDISPTLNIKFYNLSGKY